MSKRVCGRRVRDEVEARALLDAMAASGQPLGEWAQGNGIQGRSLHAWRLILDRKRARGAVPSSPRGRPKSAPRLVELLPRRALAEPSYVIHVGELRVEVRADFDGEVLQRLVRVVAAC